jgi:hypothetical protein
VPQLEPRRAPPPDYYAANLRFLVGEVAQRNRDLLGPAELAFIDAWAAANVPAQRLLARLFTRKGPWFRADRLNYDEIADVPAALAELAHLGLVRHLPDAPADRLLDLYTRGELKSLFPTLRSGAQQRTKAEWIHACVTRYTDSAVRARVARRYVWLDVPASVPFGVCRLLFFGTDRRDLTEFVLQDLGLLRFEQYEIGAHTRAFGDRAELERFLECRRLGAWFAERGTDSTVAAAIRRRLWTPEPSRTVARLRDRLLNGLGHAHERRREFDEALESYTLSSVHPARERRARLLGRLGDRAGQRALVAKAIAAPWSAEEEDYALRCGESTRGIPRAVSPRICEVHDPAAGSVGSRGIERYALDQLVADGGAGWHLENHFPLGLAGLVFWHEIFAPVPGAFSHAFQHGPQDLFWPDFARARDDGIRARLAALAAPAALSAHLREVATAKRGIANQLVHWSAWTPEVVEAVAALDDRGRLLRLARHVIGNLQRARHGFPDLFIVRAADTFEFVEVKGPTDQLQPAQRTWLRWLERLELPGRVMKFRA